jgi:hypothetical protein
MVTCRRLWLHVHCDNIGVELRVVLDFACSPFVEAFGYPRRAENRSGSVCGYTMLNLLRVPTTQMAYINRMRSQCQEKIGMTLRLLLDPAIGWEYIVNIGSE